MEAASKDVLFTIAMNLELPTLLKWCQSNSRINRDVCQNDNVWRAKLLRDYPDYERFKLNRSLKETYVFMYQLSYIKELLGTKESLYDIFMKKTLFLIDKNLNKIPAFDLPNLQELYLGNNKLRELPETNLPNLRHLGLSNNRFTKIPTVNLPNLRFLYLNENPIQEVDNPFPTNFPKLERISLYNVNLTEENKLQLKEKYGNKVIFNH
jgi:hypothetical protein